MQAWRLPDSVYICPHPHSLTNLDVDTASPRSCRSVSIAASRESNSALRVNCEARAPSPEAIASTTFDQSAAKGFVHVHGLSSKIAARRDLGEH